MCSNRVDFSRVDERIGMGWPAMQACLSISLSRIWFMCKNKKGSRKKNSYVVFY